MRHGWTQPSGVARSIQSALDGAHAGVDARRAVDREHRARGARAGVQVGQRGERRERAERGGDAREADPAPELLHVHVRHRSLRQ